jgi:hypothetical protein
VQNKFFAAPFLDCKPVPKGPDQPTIYEVSIAAYVSVPGEETSITVPAIIDADGSVKLHCDLAPFALPINTLCIAFITAYNISGPVEFSSGAQIAFTLTDATHAVITAINPAPPENVHISPD